MEANKSYNLDMMTLVRSQVPDPDGALIPDYITNGSAMLSGQAGESARISVATTASTFSPLDADCHLGCTTCEGSLNFVAAPSPASLAVGASQQLTASAKLNTGTTYTMSGTWSSANSSVAAVSSAGLATGQAPGSTTATFTSGESIPLDTVVCGDVNCPDEVIVIPVQTSAASLTCATPVTRGTSTTCTVSGPSGESISGWQFTDSSGNTVTSSSTSTTWSGVMVTSGTVKVNAGGASPSASITVTNRPNFAFTAVNPSQVMSNTLTCYNGNVITLTSPPDNQLQEDGGSCADLAFSFVTSPTISDGGPNNGYQYVTGVSPTLNGQATQYQYIVVSDLLSATTFYNAQCGTYSSSNPNGFIAGSQLKQNVFDHEMGPVLSHWTEYVNAQNSSANNVGAVVEAQTGAPGMPQQTFINNVNSAGSDAQDTIIAAGLKEPCSGLATYDSSQSCGYCGIINVGPSYYSCGGAQPVAYCQ